VSQEPKAFEVILPNKEVEEKEPEQKRIEEKKEKKELVEMFASAALTPYRGHTNPIQGVSHDRKKVSDRVRSIDG